ncbi:hypothetical protein J2755_001746 [Methanohalophilus levihalophilus]|uniref:hypothetical protein n=1 Tax=Methanohalophilus levihalophilus TaxID=1431282 RepID=UPI001AE667D9|nr:hypothetical protein [Methanohalophilus levihalophilus]MBP2030798.1 hypothetical protein [Methanohalophilus levihalophilus]
MMHYYNTIGILDFVVQILLILLILGVAIALLSRSGLMNTGNNEKLVAMEKDISEIKKTVDEIKEKLEEI